MQGHKRPLLCKNHSRTFVYGPIFMKICVNANIMKTQYLRTYVLLHLTKKLCLFVFTSLCHYNLDLLSYGQLLSLFSKQPRDLVKDRIIILQVNVRKSI